MEQWKSKCEREDRCAQCGGDGEYEEAGMNLLGDKVTVSESRTVKCRSCKGDGLFRRWNKRTRRWERPKKED